MSMQRDLSLDFSGLEFEPFRQDDHLMRFIGRAGLLVRDDQVIMKVEMRAEVTNPGGIVHGGVLSTVCDVAMYETAKLAFQTDCITGSQEIKFLRPFLGNDPIFVVTDVLRSGRISTLCSARVMQRGKLGAFSTAQFTRV